MKGSTGHWVWVWVASLSVYVNGLPAPRFSGTLLGLLTLQGVTSSLRELWIGPRYQGAKELHAQGPALRLPLKTRELGGSVPWLLLDSDDPMVVRVWAHMQSCMSTYMCIPIYKHPCARSAGCSSGHKHLLAFPLSPAHPPALRWSQILPVAFLGMHETSQRVQDGEKKRGRGGEKKGGRERRRGKERRRGRGKERKKGRERERQSEGKRGKAGEKKEEKKGGRKGEGAGRRERGKGAKRM